MSICNPERNFALPVDQESRDREELHRHSVEVTHFRVETKKRSNITCKNRNVNYVN